MTAAFSNRAVSRISRIGFGIRRRFTWTPLNADSEHYTVVSTSCEGAIAEELELKRIDGKWLYAARIYDRESQKNFLYCRDANFPISDKWTTSLQPCFPEFKTSYSIL